ncbi:Pyrrolo-quinoline quinone [Halosimplex carlsbadense 2-9-1]|uniref:Pyrrolo-quinoline quinone n=1 Tax=Halosimplex carlsbadense 2-9-1 TaxID=797114 RepID=M0CRB7_9EURY|nr:PQQ-binding-like beta-propeller repeat protein [Halosimplex carlsbadense]ELZ25771.1 Pyrrolo-quinoline quinone [Halosimplex carlsbadense 2-9-1]
MPSHSRRRFLAAVGAASLAGCTLADGTGLGGDGWPETAETTTDPLPDESNGWPQFGRDARHSGFAPEVRIDDPTEEWSVERSGGLATPAVVGDRVFVYGSTATESGDGDGECMVDALRASDGRREWRRPLPGFGDAISGCPPLVYHGSVYVGTASRTGIHVIDARDGSPRWSHETGGSINEAALGYRGTVYSSTGSELLAFDQRGREQWTYRTGDDRLASGSPAGADGRVLYTTSIVGTVVALEPGGTGSSDWRYVREASFGTPTVANGAAYVPARFENSRIHAVDLADGERRWKRPVDLVTGLATDGDRLYGATGSGDLVAVTTVDGTERWRTTLAESEGANLDTRPLVTDRSVVVTADAADASGSATTTAVDRRTGERRWSVDHAVDRGLRGAVAAGGRVYVPLYASDEPVYRLVALSDR